MQPLNLFNDALQYIEDNLTGEIDFQRMAQLAGCSEYHFRRMFSFLAGMPLSEYIRLRRLSQAAIALSNNDIKIVDLAIQYGYESSDGFARAFQSMHGITPSAARRDGTSLKAFPPVRFQLSVRGGNEMDYRIVDKAAFKIAGLKRTVTLVYNGVNPEIAEMWASLTEQDIFELKALSDTDPKGMISASVNFAESRSEGTSLDHYVGVATTESDTENWQVLEIPPLSWAVFTVRGKFPEVLQNTWGRIYAEWFPMSGYESAEGPEILWNEHKDTTRPDYHSEIWIPITRAKA